MKKFYIVRGLPGSGKSTLVKELSSKIVDAEVFVFSTDNYWLRPDGYYDFNARRIGEAHAWNFKLCKEALALALPHVILDNTNTTLREFDQYINEAVLHGYNVFILEPNTPWSFDVQECFRKNTHNVPLDVIQKMYDRWQTSDEIVRLSRGKCIYE